MRERGGSIEEAFVLRQLVVNGEGGGGTRKG